MKKIKFGFTLGEVLMTLGIVGVIAALTTPALIENVNESKYRSLLKSFYSKFSVNLDSILTTAGAAEGSSPCDSFDCFNDISADTFVSANLFNATRCTAGCNSVAVANPPNGFIQGEIYSLANGMTMNVMPRDGGCGTCDANCNNFKAQYNNGANIDLGVCALVYVDVNGNKGPNNFKNDKFAFYLLSSKDIKNVNAASEIVTVGHRSSALLPLGLSTSHGHYNSYLGQNNTCDSDNEQNCTAEIMDGEGYWKRRDDCWVAGDNNGKTEECKNCTFKTDSLNTQVNCYKN